MAPKSARSVGRIILLVAEGIAVLLIVLIHVNVLPRFVEIFKQQGGKLPGLTQLLLNIEGWKAVIFLWNVGAIFILLIALEIYSKNARLKWILSSIFLILLVLYFILAAAAVYLPMLDMVQVMQETGSG